MRHRLPGRGLPLLPDWLLRGLSNLLAHRQGSLPHRVRSGEGGPLQADRADAWRWRPRARARAPHAQRRWALEPRRLDEGEPMARARERRAEQPRVSTLWHQFGLDALVSQPAYLARSHCAQGGAGDGACACRQRSGVEAWRDRRGCMGPLRKPRARRPLHGSAPAGLPRVWPSDGDAPCMCACACVRARACVQKSKTPIWFA